VIDRPTLRGLVRNFFSRFIHSNSGNPDVAAKIEKLS